MMSSRMWIGAICTPCDPHWGTCCPFAGAVVQTLGSLECRAQWRSVLRRFGAWPAEYASAIPPYAPSVGCKRVYTPRYIRSSGRNVEENGEEHRDAEFADIARIRHAGA